jgi:urease accessory protein
VKARATAVVEADGSGGTRLAVLRSAAPLILRPAAGALWLVGGAGGPLGGDDLELDISVGPGAGLTVRTAAASVVLAGGIPSRLTIRAEVAAGGRLAWLPEPSVATARCNHVVRTRLRLEAGCELTWREEVVLGRHGEEPGDWDSRTDADLDGRPLLRNALRLGPGVPGWNGPAVVGPAKAVGTVLVVPGAGPQPPDGDSVAVLPLAGAGVLVTAVAGDALTLRRRLEAATSGW